MTVDEDRPANMNDICDIPDTLVLSDSDGEDTIPMRVNNTNAKK